MGSAMDEQSGHAQVADDAHAAPPEHAAPLETPQQIVSQLSQEQEGTWPHLSPAAIDRGWQQAINGGPRMMGRQVAYALAASLQRDPDADQPLPAADAYPSEAPSLAHSRLLALAAVAEHLPARLRLDLLREVLDVADPEPRARALMLLAPYLSGERRNAALCDAHRAALEVAAPRHRAALLATLLPMLRGSSDDEMPTGIVAETLDVARGIGNVEARLRALTALAPRLPPTVRIAVLLAALDTIAGLPNPDHQTGALVALAPHLPGEVHHRALTVVAHIQNPAARARALTVLAQYLPPRLQPRLRAAALEAIATIHSEDERAQALAAFAPHLEAMAEGEETFPALLERALALAVNMNRREARARALVGLQARLPHHLKGEALAAVNAISDEHVRAQQLADLAPSLPPDLAVAALAVAHYLRQRDARLLALKSLGRHLPDRAAERTWLDALAVAMGLPRQLERVLALAELIPLLPPELGYRTLVHALTTARSIPKERARVRALSELAPLLAPHPQLLGDALADANLLTNPVEKVGALSALLPHLPPGAPQQKAIGVILENIGEITVEYRRARALSGLAAFLGGGQLQAALEAALQIADPYDQATTLIALLPRLPAEQRERILQQAWKTACAITDHYDRVTALAALWPLAGQAMRQDILREGLDAAAAIEDEYDRASGLSVFAPLLVSEDGPSALPPESQVVREAVLAACQLASPAARAEALAQLTPCWLNVRPSTAAFALWCEVLAVLSRRPVGHLLSDLAALMPVLRAVGGREAALDATQVIRAARRW